MAVLPRQSLRHMQVFVKCFSLFCLQSNWRSHDPLLCDNEDGIAHKKCILIAHQQCAQQYKGKVNSWKCKKHCSVIQKFDLFFSPEKKVDFLRFQSIKPTRRFSILDINNNGLNIQNVWQLSTLGLLILNFTWLNNWWRVYLRCFPWYLIQSNCSTTNMNTCSKTANPPSTPALSRETFEELMEISQVPHEKENLQSRVSRLETQLSQLMTDNSALPWKCDVLAARVKCLDSMANHAASSIPNMTSATNKCKKRRLDAL